MKYQALLLLVLAMAPLPLVAHASNDVCTSCSDDDKDSDKASDVWNDPQNDDLLVPNDDGAGVLPGDGTEGLVSDSPEMPQLDPLTPQPEPTGLPK